MIKETSIKECDSASVSAFDCGEDQLNLYFRSHARQNDDNGYGKTFVLCDGDDIVGFYTLAAASIQFEHLPPSLSKRLPKYPAPAIRIARLAVAKGKQGQGYGALLLKNIFRRILLGATNLGIAFILVDAKDSATGFYEHFGFSRLEKEGNTFALPVSVVLKSIVG